MNRASDTRPKDGDAPKIAAPLASSAVAASDAPKGSQDSTMSHSTAELVERLCDAAMAVEYETQFGTLASIKEPEERLASCKAALSARLKHLERALSAIARGTVECANGDTRPMTANRMSRTAREALEAKS